MDSADARPGVVYVAREPHPAATPGLLAREWGPFAMFSGGYRVAVPLSGAMLQRVAGIDLYTFSAFMMIGVPVLTGLALGASATGRTATRCCSCS